MPRKAPTPSQPEFGDLLAAQDLRKIVTVAQLTSTIRRLLETQIGRVWVTGEVTNMRAQSSGHAYFTLKDATAQVSCVLFRGEAAASRHYVQDGQRLLLGGEITVYEPRGKYQLRVTSVELQGVGALQLAFEQLKRKLLAEGLFDSARKRPLPRYPQRIGLVTSPTGAAIRDVLHVIARRQPGLEIVLAPARVQGQGAAAEIAQAIVDLNALHAGGRRRLDLILLTRGGGSLEDLWAFNEEVVARAIHASALPVVSGVGHEVDITISDLVADLRAATPTAAAEIITEGVFSSRQFVAGALERVRRLMRRELTARIEDLEQLCERLGRSSPRRRVEENFQALDDCRQFLARAISQQIQNKKTAAAGLSQRIARLKPSRWLEDQRLKLEELRRRARTRFEWQLANRNASLLSVRQRLKLLSPVHVLDRGYSITLDAETGRVLRSVAETAEGARILTRLRDGELESAVRRRRLVGGE
ncbi:MAG: exodeoxyribonuclease VII large subunit [Verrucomicrobia bacterium]|nr:exodeoxyribonuclease VII large subunit [Verrucomicrobiota bacterium]